MAVSYLCHTTGLFAPTRWTLVDFLKTKDSPWATTALNELCTLYWQPVYRYIRLLGQSPVDAEDLTQLFFVRILKDALFENSDRNQGKLRTLICVAVNRFIIDEGRRQRTLKRGGRISVIPCDITEIEGHLLVSSGQAVSPETAFARQCCRDILDEVFELLEESFRRKGKLDLYHATVRFIPKRANDPMARKEAAEALGLSLGAFGNRVMRLREEYRRLLTNRIAKTVASWDHIDEEMRYMKRVFSN